MRALLGAFVDDEGKSGIVSGRRFALFAGGWALQQLWLFWLAPIVGGALGGFAYTWLGEAKPDIVGDATAS